MAEVTKTRRATYEVLRNHLHGKIVRDSYVTERGIVLCLDDGLEIGIENSVTILCSAPRNEDTDAN